MVGCCIVLRWITDINTLFELRVICMGSLHLVLLLLIGRGGQMQVFRVNYEVRIRSPCCVVRIPHNSWVLIIIENKILPDRKNSLPGWIGVLRLLSVFVADHISR